MKSRATRQYWDGYYDALAHCSRLIRTASKTDMTAQQMKQLAAAIETKARSIMVDKSLDSEGDTK